MAASPTMTCLTMSASLRRDTTKPLVRWPSCWPPCSRRWRARWPGQRPRGQQTEHTGYRLSSYQRSIPLVTSAYTLHVISDSTQNLHSMFCTSSCGPAFSLKNQLQFDKIISFLSSSLHESWIQDTPCQDHKQSNCSCSIQTRHLPETNQTIVYSTVPVIMNIVKLQTIMCFVLQSMNFVSEPQALCCVNFLALHRKS